MAKETKPCPVCNGSGSRAAGVDEDGTIYEEPCMNCGGTGSVPA